MNMMQEKINGNNMIAAVVYEFSHDFESLFFLILFLSSVIYISSDDILQCLGLLLCILV